MSIGRGLWRWEEDDAGGGGGGGVGGPLLPPPVGGEIFGVTGGKNARIRFLSSIYNSKSCSTFASMSSTYIKININESSWDIFLFN
jgi:hypothetical protein